LVVKVAHFAIGSHLGVNMTTLALIEINLSLFLANSLGIILNLVLHGLAFALLSYTVG
jgi:hypothetical protein